MTGTDFCVNKPHMSQSYLNHLVYIYIYIYVHIFQNFLSQFARVTKLCVIAQSELFVLVVHCHSDVTYQSGHLLCLRYSNWLVVSYYYENIFIMTSFFLCVCVTCCHCDYTYFIVRCSYMCVCVYIYIYIYEGRSEINASYLFPWKLHQIQRAQ